MEWFWKESEAQEKWPFSNFVVNIVYQRKALYYHHKILWSTFLRALGMWFNSSDYLWIEILLTQPLWWFHVLGVRQPAFFLKISQIKQYKSLYGCHWSLWYEVDRVLKNYPQSLKLYWLKLQTTFIIRILFSYCFMTGKVNMKFCV